MFGLIGQRGKHSVPSGASWAIRLRHPGLHSYRAQHPRGARTWVLLVALTGLGVSGFAAYPTVASAAPVRVTNCNDSGPGSLRQAVASANPGQTVNFNLSRRCSIITLASTIDMHDLTINGPGARALAVSGNNANTVFYTYGAVTVSGLTIENGSTPSNTYGAGIANNGSLTVTNSILSNNKGAYAGGGIFSDGWLTVTDSTLKGNSAGYGGGIWSAGGTLSITDSTVSGNSAGYGGGIDSAGANSPGTQTVTDCTVSDNIASQGGGGIEDGGTLSITDSTLTGNNAGYGGGVDTILANAAKNNSTLTISNSTVSGNVANVGGGIANYITATVSDSTVSGNTAQDEGGGIHNSSGTLTVSDSTVSGNHASNTYYGGGMSNDNGMVTISNSTVSGNSAAAGGGVYNIFGTTNVDNSTVSGNTGGDLYNPQGTLNATSSIVANGITRTDCLGSITDLGYNLDDDGSCVFSGTSLSHTPSGLDPAGLQNNGGPTQTIALEPGSPAIGHVSNASLCPAIDQRGLPRTVPCDIGAFQTQAFGIHRRRR